MPTSSPRFRRILDPGDRIAEAMLGLIMALTFTGSLSVADAGRNDVRAMLIGALGCNLAWGIIDGIIYVMITHAARSSERKQLHMLRRTTDAAHARSLLAELLPGDVAAALTADELDTIHRRLAGSTGRPPEVTRLAMSDLLGGLAVCLLVFLSTFPIAIPFLLMDSVAPAMRTSNIIAITMLFVAGVAYGRATGLRPWLVGLSMVLLGCVLVAITIALGG